MTLQRLVLDFRNGELVARALYRSSLGGPNPGTKARRREVQELTREGLRQALASMEGGAVLVGTSGFASREDVILCTDAEHAPSGEHKKPAKGA